MHRTILPVLALLAVLASGCTDSKHGGGTQSCGAPSEPPCVPGGPGTDRVPPQPN